MSLETRRIAGESLAAHVGGRLDHTPVVVGGGLLSRLGLGDPWSGETEVGGIGAARAAREERLQARLSRFNRAPTRAAKRLWPGERSPWALGGLHIGLGDFIFAQPLEEELAEEEVEDTAPRRRRSKAAGRMQPVANPWHSAEHAPARVARTQRRLPVARTTRVVRGSKERFEPAPRPSRAVTVAPEAQPAAVTSGGPRALDLVRSTPVRTVSAPRAVAPVRRRAGLSPVVSPVSRRVPARAQARPLDRIGARVAAMATPVEQRPAAVVRTAASSIQRSVAVRTEAGATAGARSGTTASSSGAAPARMIPTGSAASSAAESSYGRSLAGRVGGAVAPSAAAGRPGQSERSVRAAQLRQARRERESVENAVLGAAFARAVRPTLQQRLRDDEVRPLAVATARSAEAPKARRGLRPVFRHSPLMEVVDPQAAAADAQLEAEQEARAPRRPRASGGTGVRVIRSSGRSPVQRSATVSTKASATAPSQTIRTAAGSVSRTAAQRTTPSDVSRTAARRTASSDVSRTAAQRTASSDVSRTVAQRTASSEVSRTAVQRTASSETQRSEAELTAGAQPQWGRGSSRPVRRRATAWAARRHEVGTASGGSFLPQVMTSARSPSSLPQPGPVAVRSAHATTGSGAPAPGRQQRAASVFRRLEAGGGTPGSSLPVAVPRAVRTGEGRRPFVSFPEGVVPVSAELEPAVDEAEPSVRPRVQATSSRPRVQATSSRPGVQATARPGKQPTSARPANPPTSARPVSAARKPARTSGAVPSITDFGTAPSITDFGTTTVRAASRTASVSRAAGAANRAPGVTAGPTPKVDTSASAPRQRRRGGYRPIEVAALRSEPTAASRSLLPARSRTDRPVLGGSTAPVFERSQSTASPGASLAPLLADGRPAVGAASRLGSVTRRAIGSRVAEDAAVVSVFEGDDSTANESQAPSGQARVRPADRSGSPRVIRSSDTSETPALRQMGRVLQAAAKDSVEAPRTAAVLHAAARAAIAGDAATVERLVTKAEREARRSTAARVARPGSTRRASEPQRRSPAVRSLLPEVAPRPSRSTQRSRRLRSPIDAAVAIAPSEVTLDAAPAAASSVARAPAAQAAPVVSRSRRGSPSASVKAAHRSASAPVSTDSARAVLRTAPPKVRARVRALLQSKSRPSPLGYARLADVEAVVQAVSQAVSEQSPGQRVQVVRDTAGRSRLQKARTASSARPTTWAGARTASAVTDPDPRVRRAVSAMSVFRTALGELTLPAADDPTAAAEPGATPSTASTEPGARQGRHVLRTSDGTFVSPRQGLRSGSASARAAAARPSAAAHRSTLPTADTDTVIAGPAGAAPDGASAAPGAANERSPRRYASRPSFQHTVGEVDEVSHTRPILPTWAKRASGAPLVRSSEQREIVRALSQAHTPEQVVQIIADHGADLATPDLGGASLGAVPSSLPAPVLQVIEQVREGARAELEERLKAARAAAGTEGPMPERRQPKQSAPEPQVIRTARNLRRGRKTRRSQGIGDDRVMKLAQKLQSLIHLAQGTGDRDEARRHVRMAEDSQAARGEAQAGTQNSGTGSGDTQVDIESLVSEVVQQVNRELSLRRERRQEDPDGGSWW